MAKRGINGTTRLSTAAQGNLVAYMNQILTQRKQFTDYFVRLAALDVAYAAYVAHTNDEVNTDGLDFDSILQDTLRRTKDTQIQLVASQVDSTVAHLAEVFLSGSPLFPVVADSDDTELASKFEALIQYHGRKAAYIRNLLHAFFDAAKYNICAIDPYWDSMPALLPDNLLLEDSLKILASPDTAFSMTTLRHIDPYNLIMDFRYAPSDVATRGEFVGEVMLMGATELKTLLNKFSNDKTGRNIKLAQNSKLADTMKNLANTSQNNPGMSGFVTANYVERPQISNLVGATANLNNTGWGQWMGMETSLPNTAKNVYSNYSGLYEVVKLYAKIIPDELGIITSKSNTPQVWELWLVNGAVLIYAEPKVTAHGNLPIKIGQLLEDGNMYQTKSIAERALPFQATATDMLAIRINGSKRAINDREYYDPRHINSTDINNPSATAKIPVTNLGLNSSIGNAVYSVPYRDNGTASALTDMSAVIQLANNMQGINPFDQGQTMKGNRSASEFTGIESSATERKRMGALMLEATILIPVKDTIKLNLILHQDVLKGFDEIKGRSIEIKPEDLITTIIEFKLADGYTPRAKLAHTEVLRLAFEVLVKNPELKGSFDMAKMYAHLMAQSGVRNLEQYAYTQEDEQTILAKAMPIIQRMQQQKQREDLAAQTTQQGDTPNATESGTASPAL